jgi:cytochrome c5
VRRVTSLVLFVTCAACSGRAVNSDRAQAVEHDERTPESMIPDGIDERPDSAMLALHPHFFDTDDESQPDTLPELAFGMSLEQIRDGDRLFHGKGACRDCHGDEAQGLPRRGKTLTAGTQFVPKGDWNAIDSVISVGMPDRETRSPIAMPPRGKHSDLDAEEMRTIAAYVWAISQARGEPWPGGHATHAGHDWRSSSRTSIP